MPQERRAILKASAVAIIIYAVVVVIQANSIPYLGIRFFVQHVQKVSALPVDPAPVGMVLPNPQPGDLLIQIAGKRVEQGRSPLGTIVNTIAHLRNDARFPASPIQRIEDLRKLDGGVASLGGERFVRLRFEAPASDRSGRGTFDRWFLVDDPPWQHSFVSIAWLAIESIVFWFGWLVFRRRPEDDSAALFFLMCIVTVGAYMGWYHWLEIASSPALVFVFAICAMAVPQISLHFHMVAPTPKRVLQLYPRSSLLLLYGVPCAIQLGVLWSISRLFYTFRHELPAEGARWEAILATLLWVYMVLGAGMFVGCVASLWHSYRFPRQPSHRDQVRWLLGGSIVAGLFIGYSLWTAAVDRAGFLVGEATWAMFAASLSFVAAYSVSILRYRFLSIEEIVEQRGWKYLLIRLLGAILFYGLVIAVVALTPRLFANIPQPAGLLPSAFVVLVLYILTTIRSWLSGILDRRFYRERSQLDWAMRRMNEAVGNLVEPSTIHRHVLVIATNSVNARGGVIYLRSVKAGFNAAETTGEVDMPRFFEASHPLVEQLQQGSLLQRSSRSLIREDTVAQLLRNADAELAQPLLREDKLIGFVLIGPRREGMYNSAELGFLAGVADLATIAIQSAQSHQTLEKLNRDLSDRVARVSVPLSRPERVEPPPAEAKPVEPPLLFVEALRGSGTAIDDILRTVRKVASSNSTVLIRGESGTGKSMLAEVIHRNSPRSVGPFVKVHCAALSSSLLESELFGHVKGAFTGAIRDKIGRFQMADRGTLFLDEIGDISLDTQTKLLRVLQEMTFEPVGSNESIRVDVRIIAATHQPLEELISRGKIREDLYYRLNVISIRMPSLRERSEDIPDLVSHFMTQYSQSTGKQVKKVDEEAMESLLSHGWPGNIRELQNVIEHAVVMASGESISLADLPGPLQEELVSTETTPEPISRRVYRAAIDRPAATTAEQTGPWSAEFDELERTRLMETMVRCRGNKSLAARLLGLPRSTLCSKLKKFGIN
ncbi:sigma 54-interacting transcriptional regulator [bacterium]|nr:sigma 54-interacting transcriptional regulator [bacterium]